MGCRGMLWRVPLFKMGDSNLTKHEIDCEEALKQIFQFVDHELNENDRQAMERHLHTCKSCFSRAEFERRLKGKLAELREKEPSDNTSARITRLMKTF